MREPTLTRAEQVRPAGSPGIYPSIAADRGASLLVLAAVAWAVRPTSSGPVAWAVKGKALVFYDTRDRELWNQDIDGPSDSKSFYV